MRSRFDEQLADLNKKLIEMGAMCEECISLAAKALKEGNPGIRWEVEPLDNSLDDLERNVESLCLKLLLQQQPVARDLRQVSTALKMITDIKRIGDQASDVAEIIGFLNGRTSEECEYLDQMATATIKMVTESIDSFINFACDWLTKIGGVIALVGGVMFALGWQREDAEGKSRGLMTLMAGFMLVAIAQSKNLFGL